MHPLTSEKSGWLSARLQLQEIVQEQSHAGLHHKTGNPGGGEREGKQREERGKAGASCSGWAPQPGPHGSHGAGAAPNVGPGAPRGQQAGGRALGGSPRAVFCSAQPFRSALEIPPSFRQFIYASQPAEPFGLLCGLGFFGVFFFLKGFQKRFPAPSQPRSARSPGAGRPPPPAAAPRTEASPRPPAAGGAEIQQPQPLALTRAGGEAKSASLNFWLFITSSHRCPPQGICSSSHPKSTQ